MSTYAIENFFYKFTYYNESKEEIIETGKHFLSFAFVYFDLKRKFIDRSKVNLSFVTHTFFVRRHEWCPLQQIHTFSHTIETGSIIVIIPNYYLQLI